MKVGERFERPAGGAASKLLTVEAKIVARLPVRCVRPGGQDARPLVAGADLESENAPVVIPLGGTAPAAAQPTHWLEIADEAGNDRRRSVRLRLFEIEAGDDAPGRALVIDRAPFLVAEAKVAPLVAPEGGLDGALVATWRSSTLDGDRWEVLAPDAEASVELRLPPSAVGEEAEKGDDWTGGLAGADRPLGDDRTTRPTPRAADFRFSPPARLRLRSALEARRFVEPSWNTRRILGFAGQRAPGAEIQRLGFEEACDRTSSEAAHHIDCASADSRQEPSCRWRVGDPGANQPAA